MKELRVDTPLHPVLPQASLSPLCSTSLNHMWVSAVSNGSPFILMDKCVCEKPPGGYTQPQLASAVEIEWGARIRVWRDWSHGLKLPGAQTPFLLQDPEAAYRNVIPEWSNIFSLWIWLPTLTDLFCPRSKSSKKRIQWPSLSRVHF